MLSNRRNRTTAQSLVEFALIGPLFFFSVFGVIEGARLAWTHHTLTNATKEGARYALVRGDNSDLADAPATQAKIEAHMLDESVGLDADKLTVRFETPSGMDNQNPLRVESEYQFGFIVQGFFPSARITLEANSEAIFSK